MTSSRFMRLEDVVTDNVFPDVDLALRRGQHIDADDADWYPFLVDAQDFLEAFYRRFGCELIHKSDGYFYLLPTNERLGRRHLSSGEMLVGQTLTLLYLDPATVQHGGVVTREQILAHLAGVMGAESLERALNPKRRRYDERVAQETVRTKVAEALRRLSALGFAQIVEENRVRLRPSLMRFAEPVRGTAAPEAALERLVAEGELVLADSDVESESGEAADDDGAADDSTNDANDANDASDASDDAQAPDSALPNPESDS